MFDNQFTLEEYTDDQLSPWEYYRSILLGDNGLLIRTENEIAEAAIELKNSLSDFDALEEKIFEARREVSGYVAEQCGPSAEELRASFSGTA